MKTNLKKILTVLFGAVIALTIWYIQEWVKHNYLDLDYEFLYNNRPQSGVVTYVNSDLPFFGNSDTETSTRSGMVEFLNVKKGKTIIHYTFKNKKYSDTITVYGMTEKAQIIKLDSVLHEKAQPVFQDSFLVKKGHFKKLNKVEINSNLIDTIVDNSTPEILDVGIPVDENNSSQVRKSAKYSNSIDKPILSYSGDITSDGGSGIKLLTDCVNCNFIAFINKIKYPIEIYPYDMTIFQILNQLIPIFRLVS